MGVEDKNHEKTKTPLSIRLLDGMLALVAEDFCIVHDENGHPFKVKKTGDERNLPVAVSSPKIALAKPHPGHQSPLRRETSKIGQTRKTPQDMSDDEITRFFSSLPLREARNIFLDSPKGTQRRIRKILGPQSILSRMEF